MSGKDKAEAPYLLVMPDDGVEVVLRLIEGAQRTVLVKMFEFENAPLVAALVGAKARGVDVRVLLNPVRSSGARPNDATFAELRDGGIEVNWTSSHFVITHEKSMVIDGRSALIATFNFSDKYFTRTRDYGLVVEDAAIIAEITACFEADRAGTMFQPPETGPLAWGNQTARRIVADFIDSAKKTLYIHQPKFRDWAILDHVLAACARGVKVHLLCGGEHGIEPADLLATFSAHRILARAGVHVKRQRHLKLHAKMMLADDERAMIGSMNIDRDAYDVRRELGIVFADKAPVAVLLRRFETDWDEAKRYEAPDPLSRDLMTAIDAEALDPSELETVLMHE